MVSEKKNLREALSALEYEELINLQKDLYSGGQGIRQLISNKIKEISTLESRNCATCGSLINLKVENEFTLIFGTAEVKKRASFCALDCMEYFTAGLKQLTSAKKLQQKQQ
jgi:hypothetical protein